MHRTVGGLLRENCYTVSGPGGEALVIDPGHGAESLLERLSARELDLRGVLLTHAHADHIAAAAELAESTSAPVHLHRADSPLLRRANFYRRVLYAEGPIRVPSIDVDLAGKATLCFGALEVRVLHTPGHTPGSVCFAIGSALFSGDTILADGVGGGDLPESDAEALQASLGRIADAFAGSSTVRPGHGDAMPLGAALSRIASSSA